MNFKKLLILAAMSSMLVACGGSSDKPTPTPEPTPTPTPEPGPEPTPTPEPTPEPEPADFYLVGSFNEWSPVAEYQFYTGVGEEALTPSGKKQYVLEDVEVRVNDEFKVTTGNSGTWYPDGMGNNMSVEEDGVYTFYFTNVGGEPNWLEGYVLAEKTGELEPETEWNEEVRELLAEHLYGYDLPFFGQGLTLNWSVENVQIIPNFVEYEALRVDGEDDLELTDLEAVVALLEEDGFVPTNEEEEELDPTEGITLGKEVVVEELGKRFIAITLGLVDANESFAEEGKLQVLLQDPYWYSFEETPYNGAFKTIFGFEGDFIGPDGKYEKAEALDWLDEIEEGYLGITAYETGDKALGLLSEAYALAGWDLLDASGTAYDGFEAYSADNKMLVTARYYAAYDAVRMFVEPAPELDPRVVAVSEVLGLNPRKWSVDSTEGVNFIQIPETSEEGLEQICAGYLNKFVESGYRVFGEIEVKEDSASARVLNEEGTMLVEIYCYLKEGVKTTQLVIYDYEMMPQELINVAQGAFGLGFDKFEYDSEDEYYYTYFKYDGIIRGESDLSKALDSYLEKITTYDAEFVIAGGKTVSYDNKVAYATYYKDNIAVTVYVYSPSAGGWYIQIELDNQYVPPAESAFKTEIEQALGISLKWDASAQCYFTNGPITLEEEQTYLDYVNNQVDAITELMNLTVVDTQSGSSYAQVRLLDEDNRGYIEMVAYTSSSTGKDMYQIAVYLFDENVNPYVNAIGAILGTTFTETEEGVYTSGLVEIGYKYYLYGYTADELQQYGDIILGDAEHGLIGANVGFVRTEKGYTEEGALYGLYVNEEEGLEARIEFQFGKDGKTTGVIITITEAAE